MTTTTRTTHGDLFADLRHVYLRADNVQTEIRKCGLKALTDLMALPDDPTMLLLPLPVGVWERAMRQETYVTNHNLETSGLPIRRILKEIYTLLSAETVGRVDRKTKRDLLISAICGLNRIGGLVMPISDLEGYSRHDYEYMPLYGNRPFVCQAMAMLQTGYFVIMTRVLRLQESSERGIFHRRFGGLEPAQGFALQLARMTETRRVGDYTLPRGDRMPHGLDIVNAVLPPVGSYVHWK